MYLSHTKVMYLSHTKLMYLSHTKYMYLSHTKVKYVSHTKVKYLSHTKVNINVSIFKNFQVVISYFLWTMLERPQTDIINNIIQSKTEW